MSVIRVLTDKNRLAKGKNVRYKDDDGQKQTAIKEKYPSITLTDTCLI